MFAVGKAATPGADPSENVFWWLVRLRWLALIGVAAILVLAGPVLDRLPADSAGWLWSVAGALAAYNAALAIMGPQRGPAWLTPFRVQIAVDCIALASLVHFAGGVENPFLPLFVLHVVNANIVLSGRDARRVLFLAIALISAIVLGEGTGVVTHYCLGRAGEHGSAGALDLRSLAVLGGLVLTLVASSMFTRFLTARLRQGQRKLVATVAELNAEKDRLAGARVDVETERARLQAIIDCMADAVVFVGPEGNVLFSNERAREVWPGGAPAADSPSFEALFEAVLKNRLRSGSQSTFERGERAFEATYSLVRSLQGETLGMVMVARDVTERLAIEKHLMHDEQMSVVGKLAAAVAHEINNPIGVIFLYSQHALATLSPESPIYKHLDTIRRNADSCRKIVGGLLNLARRHEPERRPVDLRQLCREVVDSVRPLAASAGVRVSAGGYGSDLPLWARADAGMLRQAVLNLAVNAIEAVAHGGEVSIRAYEAQDGKTAVHAIEVRDTGEGIAGDQVEQVFQPFFTTKPNGTGLGLAIAENVVKSHQGRIQVESVAGTGTIFRIVLPDGAGGDVASLPLRRASRANAVGGNG